MDDKKAVHHVSPDIEVVKHHQDSLPSWDELKYFIRKYYLFLLIIALIPVVLYSLGQQLANRGSAAPRLQLNTGGKVEVQGGECTHNSESDKCTDQTKPQCRLYDTGPLQGKRTGDICTCIGVGAGAGYAECPWHYDWTCKKDNTNTCPAEPTLAQHKECISGDQLIADCGTNPNGSDATCYKICTNGLWVEKVPPVDCPDNDAVARNTKCFINPTPTGGGYYGGVPPPSNTPASGGGGYKPNCGPGGVNCEACGYSNQGTCTGPDFETCCHIPNLTADGCRGSLTYSNGGCH